MGIKEKELDKWDFIKSHEIKIEKWEVTLSKYQMKSDYASVVRILGEIKVSGFVKSRCDLIWSIGAVSSEKYSNQPSDVFAWAEQSIKNLKVKNIVPFFIANLLYGTEIPCELLDSKEVTISE